jgi:hypothetical protein
LAGRAIYRFTIVSGKIIVPLFLLAAVGYGVVYLLSPWLVSQQLSKVDPRLNIVPVDLPSKVEAPLSSASIDCFGFTLRLPNGVEKTFRGDQHRTVRFRNGGLLGCEDMSRGFDLLELKISEKNTHQLLGEEVFHSKFSLMRAAMWATPEQAKWWRFRTLANQSVEYLLITKFSALSQIISSHPFTIRPIYTIASGQFRGFQVGCPDIAPFETRIDLFDAVDRHFEFDVTGPDGHGPVLTQTEINAIVASILPTPGR